MSDFGFIVLLVMFFTSPIIVSLVVKLGSYSYHIGKARAERDLKREGLSTNGLTK